MRFGFGPWECLCSGVDGGVGLLCLASHRGAQLTWGRGPTAPFHQTAGPTACVALTAASQDVGVVLFIPVFTEEEMEARGGCPACVGHAGVVELD